MKKNYFIWMFAALLLSVGIITACEEDEIEEQTKFVDVTITVTLPETYEGLSFADVGLDSIKVTAGDDVFYTDTTGKVSASVKEGAYSLNASLTEIVVGLNSTGSNGLHTVKFQGIATADFSEANKTAAIALRVSGTPEFTAFGAIADILEDDTIHLWYKGDTIDLATLFKAQLAEGDTRTLSFSYEVAAQPKKSETGGNATGQWVDLLQSYAIADDGHSLVAIDSIGAVAFDLTAITGKKREISPAVVRVTVKAAGDLIAQKEFPVVQDSVIKELIGIVPTEGITSNIWERRISGTNTFTVATPYIATLGGGMGVSWINFKGYYSDGTEKNPFSYDYEIVGSTLVYIYDVHIEAENTNGSFIPKVSDGGVTNNSGSPIKAKTSGSASKGYTVTAHSYIINDSSSHSQVGETGKFYIYSANSTKDDFLAEEFTVETVSVTGIAKLENEESQLVPNASGRRLVVGASTVTQARHFANLVVSNGPPRLYSPDENNGDPLLVVLSSVSPAGALEVVANGTQAAATVSVDGNYVAAGYVRLSATGQTLAAETPITFKVCPKSKFNQTTGEPSSDPEWTITVNTKIYAN